MPDLSARHRRTLEAVFASPTPADLRWNAIAALLEAVGAELRERAGSRVAIVLKGRVHVLHRPHPKPETPRGTVRSVRAILEEAGIRPD